MVTNTETEDGITKYRLQYDRVSLVRGSGRSEATLCSHLHPFNS